MDDIVDQGVLDCIATGLDQGEIAVTLEVIFLGRGEIDSHTMTLIAHRTRSSSSFAWIVMIGLRRVC